jgi:DNA-binding IclR family transcriptional regulator
MPGNEPLQSVTRALHILELAANSRSGITLHQISNGLGISKQAAHHIVRTLLHEGFMEKVGSPIRYQWSDKLSCMRQRKLDWNQRVLVRATPVAIRLARASGGHVAIGQFAGGELLGRLSVPGGEGGEPLFTFGWRFLPYGSALGYLAFLGEREIADHFEAHSMAGADRAYWRSPEDVLATLDAVRRDGYLAIVKSGILRVSAPVFDGGAPTAMISLVRSADAMARGEAGRCVALVRKAAERLTASLRLSTAGRYVPVAPRRMAVGRPIRRAVSRERP